MGFCSPQVYVVPDEVFWAVYAHEYGCFGRYTGRCRNGNSSHDVGEHLTHVGRLCDVLEESPVGGTEPSGTEVRKHGFQSIL